MDLNEIVLDQNISIYIGQYNWAYNKEQFLNRIEQNILISNYTYDNTSILIFNCPEFDDIKSIGLESTKKLSNLNNWDGSWASKVWIYKQDKTKKKEYYHKHIHTTQLPYSNIPAPIINDWTFVFYLQIPSDLKNEEGMIFFKTSNDEPYKLLPKEGDFIVFPSTLSHLVKSNNDSKTERISICGNISFNLPVRGENKTLI